MKAVKVLHVLDHSVPLHSGYAFRTLSLLQEQRKLGWQTEHVTSTKHYGATADRGGGGISLLPHAARASRIRRISALDPIAVIADTSRRLQEVVDEVKPNFLHAHSPCLNGIAALRVGRRNKIPVLYEMRASWEDAAVDHGSTTEGSVRYRLSRGLESWVLKRADAITTICEGLGGDILARGIPPERVTVIPNGVNLEEFPVIDQGDAALKTKLGLDDRFVLGFVGSFYSYEGLDILIEALPRILEVHPQVQVLLVGGGTQELALKKQIAALGLGDNVTLVGRVPHSEVARYYSVIDLLVYPRKSMRLTETVTPLKPLEAMAQQRLFIASDVGGHRELVRDGETGFLFKPDDPAELSGALDRVLAAESRWPIIQAQGRRFVEKERSWQRSASLPRGVRVCAAPGEPVVNLLRLLLVGPLPPPNGGMANQTRQLASLLREEGLTVEIVRSNAPYVPAWIGSVWGVRAFFRFVPFLWQLWRASERAQVVHVMANSGPVWYLVAAPAIHIAVFAACLSS